MKTLRTVRILCTAAALTWLLLNRTQAAAPFTPNPESFEDASAVTRWIPTNGLWQIGTPSVVGPTAAHSGAACLATVLNDRYPALSNSRAESQAFDVPAANLKPRLRFWQWSDAIDDLSTVQINPSGTGWLPLSATVTSTPAGVWTRSGYDLTKFAGQSVQLGFLFTSDVDSTRGAGWYIDDVTILTGDIPVPLGGDQWDLGNRASRRRTGRWARRQYQLLGHGAER
jgi:hypothetical protein